MRREGRFTCARNATGATSSDGMTRIGGRSALPVAVVPKKAESWRVLRV